MTERVSMVADLPAVVAEEMVFVAKIGATVAAATGVPVLKIVFCGRKTQNTVINKNSSHSIQFKSNHCHQHCQVLSNF